MKVNPLLLDIPDRIHTERLLLRALQPGDGHYLYNAVIESLPELKPWMSWVQNTPTPEDLELFARKGCLTWQERKNLHFLGFQEEKFVLFVGLQSINWTVPKFEIGYWMRTSASGQGLMTEAVVALTTFATDTLGARRIEIRCDPTNPRSRRVAERAGFTLESIIKNEERQVNGRLRDTCVFALTRPDVCL